METPTWRTATTYPDAPHEYLLRAQFPQTYGLYAERIREASVSERFSLRGRTEVYRYYYAGDGYKYWIIGDVLNRCMVNQPAPSLPGSGGEGLR